MTTPLESAKKALNYEIEALKEAVNNLDDNFTKAVELILNGSGRLIVSGMGKSGLIGSKIAATLSSARRKYSRPRRFRTGRISRRR